MKFRRNGFLAAFCAVVCGGSISAFSSAAAIPYTSRLSVGQTTFDGSLTLRAARSPDGSITFSLHNNSFRSILISKYALSRGDFFDCSGKETTILAGSLYRICNVRPAQSHLFHSELLNGLTTPSPFPGATTLEPTEGQASIQLLISWHVIPRPSPLPPSPTPSSTPMPSPTPKPKPQL